MRLEYEGKQNSPQITAEGGEFFQDPAGYAMSTLAYYQCCKCKVRRWCSLALARGTVAAR